MNLNVFVEELQAAIGAMFASGPAADVQRNLKALLTQQFAKLELVTREEFEIQRALLEQARARIAVLEERLARGTDDARG